VVEPADAVEALAAVRERHHGDTVAGLDGRDVRADGDDVGGELVPEDLRVLRAGERVRLRRGDDRPGDELVQIGPADAAGSRPDQDLVVPRLARLGHVLDANVARGMEANGAHLRRCPVPR
jgi:hypothetical protein